MPIQADVYGSDRIPKAWKQGLGILTHFFVHPDFSIETSNDQAAVKVCGDRVQLGVSLVALGHSHTVVLVYTRVQSQYVFLVDSNEGACCSTLGIFPLVANLPQVNLGRLKLIDYVSPFQVEAEDRGLVMLVHEEQLALIIVQHQVAWLDHLSFVVLEQWQVHVIL